MKYAGYYNMSWEKNRRVPEAHPTQPMEDDEYKVFQRKIRPECTLSSLYFTVLKEQEFDTIRNIFYSRFYALAGNIAEEEVDFVETHSSDYRRKYQRQIAFIECRHGWIDYLTTFKYMQGTTGPIVNAQNCGIGTVLTELCLIDPDLNVRRHGNEARNLLNGYNEFDMIENYCDELMGLSMEVDDMPTAHTYFTAAINMGYMIMMIDDSDEESQYQNPLKIYATRVAKHNFDTTTGDILPCCDNPLCNAYTQTWFFCNGIGLV